MSPGALGRPKGSDTLKVAKSPLIDELVAACSVARGGLDLLASQRNRVVEDAFFRAAAAMETFLSEWLVRCLALDASSFRRTYEERAANEALTHLEGQWEPSERLWKAAKRRATVRVELPILKTQRLLDARILLNAIDDNITIRGSADLVKLAQDYLSEPYTKRPEKLGGRRAAVLDATIAIRNVLAHRSERSIDRMNRCLRSNKLPTALGRQQQDVSATGVGYYLQAKAGAKCRFELYFETLGEVANGLAPTRGRPRVIAP
jgi:hypothetical protein